MQRGPSPEEIARSNRTFFWDRSGVSKEEQGWIPGLLDGCGNDALKKGKTFRYVRLEFGGERRKGMQKKKLQTPCSKCYPLKAQSPS